MLNLSNSFHVDKKNYNTQEVIDYYSQQIFDRRLERIKEVVARRSLDVAVVLENIYDRGNTSAVMRSSEAFGFINFHIIENPEAGFKAANRVTKGTDKWLNIHKHETTRQGLGDLKDQGYKIYATHLDASVSIEEVDFSEKVAVIFGNEKDGVTDEALEHCDGRFIYPMQGFAQSFNISVAAALTLSHIYNDRRKKLGNEPELSQQQQDILVANYILRTLDKPI